MARGERDADKIRHRMASLIQKEPLARIDHASIPNAATLEELDVIDRSALASLAVRIGKARLIDNTLLDIEGSPLGSLYHYDPCLYVIAS
jgi:pantoate--beta-alanine ligase